MLTLKPLGFGTTERPPGLAQKRVGHEPAAHADSSVDAPDRERYSSVF
jgi:hypothetical protein